MKIVHLCLGCFYIDNYSYQENMLPKFHKERDMGWKLLPQRFLLIKTETAVI